jgi:hypothetical protein
MIAPPGTESSPAQPAKEWRRSPASPKVGLLHSIKIGTPVEIARLLRMLRRDQFTLALQRELKTPRRTNIEVTISAVLVLSWLLVGVVVALAAVVFIPK